MGMLLSRFRAVIFPRSGRLQSGGLASEPVVAPTADEVDREDTGPNGGTSTEDGADEREYYGLHWRKELNWRALGFEYVEEDGEEVKERPEGPERPVFHA
jgi:tRNA-specific adenosine deaminase 3